MIGLSPLHRPLFAALALVALTGCGTDAESSRPQVVASFYPLEYVAQRVAGEHAEVSNLTKPGVEPHDLELTPRQAASLIDADVVLHEQGLQPAVDEAVRNESPEQVVDAADVVSLSAAGDSSGDDPHFWLDPTLLAEVAASFTEAISEADPTHAEDYRAANEQTQADLRALDAEYSDSLAECRSRTIVVSHDAFGYLGRSYDLTVEPIAGVSPSAEPSPQRLKALNDLILRDQVTTVFSERLGSSKLADAVASDAGIDTAVLDPIEGLTSADPEADYLSLMRDNLAAIKKSLGCT